MAGPKSLAKSWRDIKTIALLTLDTLFWSKKTIFVLLISVFVLGVAVLGRVILAFGLIPGALTATQVFSTLMATSVIRFLVVFITLFYGTALISEEVEGRTLTYLFVRPIPKPAILLGKYLALVWIGAILVMPTILFSYLILYAGADMGPLTRDLPVLGQDIGIVFLALLAYGSFFSLLGAWLKHPILIGLIYAFGWEGIVALLPGFTRKMTITHYIQSIFPHDETLGAIAMMIGERSSAVESVATLILLTAFFLATAALVLREKEYVLEQ